jgi:hypothetical protein
METLSLDVKAQHPTEWCLFATDYGAMLQHTTAVSAMCWGSSCGEEGERLEQGAPIC